MIELLNEWSRAWIAYFSTIAAQNTIFLSILLIILHFLRNASAQLKYTIGLIGLIKLLIPPFLPIQIFGSAPGTLANLSFITAGGSSAPNPALMENIPIPATQLSYLSCVFILWTCAFLCFIALSVASTLRLRARLQRATKMADPGPLLPYMRALPLFRSEEISMPLTFGLFPNRIYVPPAWDRWSQACRHMVIRHEYAHIRRRDGLFHAIQILAQALYFFHPMVWLLNRRINEYREMACDDASVINNRNSRTEYSRTLVEIAETIARDSLTYETASALIRRKNELFNRVHYQLKEGVMRSISKTKTAAFAVLLAAFTLLFSWYHTGAQPGDVTTRAVVAKSETAASTRFIDVSINDEEGLRLNGERLTFEDFAARISAFSPAEKENTVVNLECSSDMPMEKLFAVQQIFQNEDMLKVNYKSDLSDALPLVLPSNKVRLRVKDINESSIARLKLSESGSVQYNKQKVPVEDINKIIRRLVDENEVLIVSIEVAPGAKYKDFIRVLDQTKKGEAKRILIQNNM